MCGICGIVNFNQEPVNEASILHMMQSMKHRGPDDEGIFIYNNAGLGFVRLSIIDLSPAGHQPMVSGDGRYVMVFNGEIYNYLELKEELVGYGYSFTTHTDSEVLLISFIHWGEDCMHHFNGMWAFVILDKVKNEIFGARDRFGVKPFYYSISNNQFIFASDIAAILKVLPSKPSVNEQIVFDFMVFNRTDQNEQTFFNEVYKLQHGCKLKSSITNPKLLISKWYDLRSNLKMPFESPSEFKSVFKSSIGLRLRSDVPVGVCFSGGLDSSAIVSTLLKDFKKEDLNTFSAVYGKGVIGDESNYIKEYQSDLSQMFFVTPTAETLFNDIKSFVKAHVEPIPSTSPYAQYKVMELAQKHVVVTLDGQGADEQLAGYHYFFGFYFKELLTGLKWLRLIYESGNYIKKHKALYGLSSMFYFLLPSLLRGKARVSERGYILQEFIKKYEKSNSIASTLYSSGSLHEALLDHFEYKLEHLLKWEDKNSMWHSLEARTPFLDYQLVERTLALPPEKIIKDGMTKHILRESMKDTLPESIRVRKDKIGFGTPQGDWFKHEKFKTYIGDIIHSDSFRSRNIVNIKKADLLYKSHLNGRIDAGNEIWKWIHLENWYREFID
jgi:asparagine synthase (glutamine-hydrolysing)